MSTIMIERLHAYPKVYALGHPAIRDLFDGPVVVQEKVDGSQFTFGVIGGELHCRSKGATLHTETTDKLFRGAIDTAMRLHAEGKLVEGYQYRGEALHRPKHNTAAYSRVPLGNVILFDVDVGLEQRADPVSLASVAGGLGLECVPTFYEGRVESAEELRAFLERESCLGGCKIEGVVVKNYARWGDDKKMLMGKYVSEQFKEAHALEWKSRNPTRTDIVESLIAGLATEARWRKAVERLRDAGELESSPRDIGRLLRAIPEDVREECEEQIRDVLFKHFWPTIGRGIVRGFPQWYKDRLVEAQFDDAA